MNELIDDICRELGIPARIFRGEPDTSSPLWTTFAQFEAYQAEKLKAWRDSFSQKVIDPLMEKAFPELYWEPLFLCSPRGRMMIRRKTPIKLEVKW